MQIFARGRELFGGGVLKVPDLVLHAVVELVWVLFSLQVKLAADGGVLEYLKMRIMVCTPNQIIFDLNPRGKLLEKVIAVLVYTIQSTHHSYREVIVDDGEWDLPMF